MKTYDQIQEEEAWDLKGAEAEWVFDDNGEQGRGDHIVALQITDVSGTVVLDLNPTELETRDTSSATAGKDLPPHGEDPDNDPWFNLIVGNHQWVPHPGNTHGPDQTTPFEEVTG